MESKLSISTRMYRKEPLKRCVLTNCSGVCCTYGVWIDLAEKEEIFTHQAVIEACMDPNSGGFDEWFEREVEDDPFTKSGMVVHSKVVTRRKPFFRNTCIFQRKDHKCALQVASGEIGKEAWYLKPFYCVLHPMDINDGGEITLDETKLIVEEEKSCLRYSNTPLSPIEIFEEELRYLLGDQLYFEKLANAQNQWFSKTDQEVE